MTKYKKEQEKTIKRLNTRIDVVSNRVTSTNDALTRVCSKYDELGKEHNTLVASHNNLKLDYYLQRAKELGYNKRISFSKDSCYNTFTIDDSPTEYSIFNESSEEPTTLFADGVKVIIPQVEIEFFANIVKATRRDAAECTLPSLSALFDKKETKK